METAYIKTPIGFAELKGDENGLASISILDQEQSLDIIPEILEEAVYQFNEYFEGTRKTFDLILNPQGTDFQKKVWDALLKIPYGKTVSYLELSKTLGDVKAIRAVAAANGEKCALILPRAVCPLVLLRALISHAPCCMPHAPRV